MTDQLLFDVERATELQLTMTGVADDLDTDRRAIGALTAGAVELLGPLNANPDRHLRALSDLLREQADDLAQRVRMVTLGGPEINAGLAALDVISANWQLIDNQGDAEGNDGVISRRDLQWATDHLDPAIATAATWLLEHPEFFAAAETARNNTDYLANGGTSFGGGTDGDGKLSLADIDAYLTKLDTWATLVPYMATIDIAAHGGQLDGVMSQADFEAFLDNQALPPQVRGAAQRVLDDSAFHDTGGIGWTDVLMVASFIPIVGDFIDGATALYYLSQGDWDQAALSALGLVPIPGVTGASVKGAKAAAEELVETAAQRTARANALESHEVVNGNWSSHVETPRLRRNGSPDPNHNFPREVENWAPLAHHERIPFRVEGGGFGGYEDLYQLPGAYGGRDGVFEWIVRDGTVMHRMFVPGSSPGNGPVGR